MQNLVESIKAIPAEKWEKSLPIGKFKALKIDNISERKYSYVAKCKVQGLIADKGVYIKVHKNYYEKSQQELCDQILKNYKSHGDWYQKFQTSDRFGVVKPLFVLENQYILVTEEAEGTDLYHLIIDTSRYFPSKKEVLQLSQHLYNTGAWLRYFHSINPVENEKYSIDNLIEYMDTRLKILTAEKRRSFPPRYRERILSTVEKEKSFLREEELGLTLSHSDFNPGNIIVDNDRITVLDFGKTKKDSYLLDVSRFYHQLFLLTFKPQFRPGVIRKLQQSLLQGFGQPNANQLLIFKFLLIRHTLTHLVGITRFWQKNLKERLYDRWVLFNELKLLDSLLS